MVRKVLVVLAVLVLLAAGGLVLVAGGWIGGEAVRHTIEDHLSSQLGRPVTIGAVNASFFPRVSLDLHDVSIGTPAVATAGEVSIATGLLGLLSRRIEGADVRISNGRLPAEAVLGLVGAAGDSHFAAGGFIIESIRSLRLEHVELVAGSQVLSVDLESALDGDRLDVERLDVEAAGTRVQARGTLASLARRQGTFTAEATSLNLDALLGAVSQLPSDAGPRGESAWDVTVALTAPEGQIGGLPFRALSTTILSRPTRTVLQPLQLGLFGGSLDGSLRVTPSGSTREFTLDGRLEGLDLAAMRGGTGRLSGTVSLTSRGASAPAILEAVHGTGRVVVADGSIDALERVRAAILAFGKPSGVQPAGSGAAFSRLEASFNLADRTLRSDDLTMNTRDFDIAGRVVLALPTGAIDMHARMVLSRELSAQAGVDLRRYAQQDGRVVLPVVISGTVAEPRASIDPAAAVNRALQNEIQRQLRELLPSGK